VSKDKMRFETSDADFMVIKMEPADSSEMAYFSQTI
jgi:hypothetical protein